MKDRDLCVAVYSSLLKIAGKTHQSQLQKYIESSKLNTLQYTRIMTLAMQGYQHTTQSIQCNHYENQTDYYALSNRILIIKSLGDVLYSKVNDRSCHRTTIGYLLYRLRYQLLLTRQKSRLLIWSVQTGAIDLLKWLCERQVTDNAKRLALELALTENKIKEASYLYTQGGTVNTMQWNFFVQSVIQSEDMDILKVILERECVNDKGMSRFAQIMIDAMKSNQSKVVDLCLDHLTQNTQLLFIDHLKKVLLYAARENYTSVLRVLIKNVGMPVDVVDQNGSTTLLIAVIYGTLPIVDFLLSNGAAVGLVDKNGMTPIKAALHNNRPDIFKRLLGYASAIDVSAILTEAYVLNKIPDVSEKYMPFITLLENASSGTEEHSELPGLAL